MTRQSALPLEIQPTPLRVHVQTIIERLLFYVGTWVIPTFFSVMFLGLVWQNFGSGETPDGIKLPISVWHNPDPNSNETPAQALTQLQQRQAPPLANDAETHRSTQAHWFLLTATAPDNTGTWAIAFPSRHAMRLSCWNQDGLNAIGSATRSATTGQLTTSQAGFALHLPATTTTITLLCQGSFQGPAHISAMVWRTTDLALAETAYKRKGVLIEGSVGVLAICMLLMALVNHSTLYGTFFAWLVLSMRMASNSVGTDFELLGIRIEPSMLIPMRQWTACLYYAITNALFSLLFKDSLAEIKAGWSLTAQQLSAIAIIPLCAFTSFQSILPVLWVATAACVGMTTVYLVRIFRHKMSRVAVWYATSIAITLLTNLNEVIAASTGMRNLLGGLNSVTAAIASSLLASLAIAEHIRVEKLSKLVVEKNLKTAYEDSPIGLFTVRSDGTLAKSNPAFRTMLADFDTSATAHLTSVFETRVHQHIHAMRVSKDRVPIELETRTHATNTSSLDDRWFAIRASTSDGDVVEGSLQDITDKVRAMARLEFLANHDPLTECLNLRGLALQFEPDTPLPNALAYFDLDRFKLINDLYGHVAGDTVLQQVCQRIKSQLGEDDLLARVGGDEFVIAFPSASMALAQTRCQHVVALISATPYMIETQGFALSISGGLVETAKFGAPALKALISYADTVCRVAKKRPAQRLVTVERESSFFNHHQDGLDIAACLEQGAVPEGLFLVMQPEMSLTAPFDSLNFEVLLRLRKPNGELVPASVIIEAAEAHGKSALIDRWVVTTTLTWLENHAAQLTRTQFVGVNLSGGSLNDEHFVEELFALFALHRTALSLVCLEITETVALTDINNMQGFIDRARAAGAKVGLDDFGAGYSSFGYLKGLSVDALKLDGSLVKDAAKNPAGTAIVRAIGGLVRSLGLKSIGEFAEDLPTIRMLVAAGIDYAQGYGISKPVLPERILASQSSADFIEDPAILAYARQLQSQQHDNPANWVEDYFEPRIH
jgi:diguanylate cyclase (GGDEF)-like protein